MTVAVNPGYTGERRRAILCLCYDPNVLQVRRMLLEHFGYKVLSTSSVEDAKTVAGQSCPDMLLMDNSHPGFDITHVAEEVKKVCPTTLAVVLSPYYGVRPGSWGHVDRFVAQDDGPNVLIAQIAELFEQQADGKTAGLAIM